MKKKVTAAGVSAPAAVKSKKRGDIDMRKLEHINSDAGVLLRDPATGSMAFIPGMKIAVYGQNKVLERPAEL